MMRREVKESAARRLRRIQGQVAGLERMIADDRACIDVLRQISSAQQALNGVARVVMKGHLEHCLARALETADDEEKRRLTDDILETMFALKKR